MAGRALSSLRSEVYSRAAEAGAGFFTNAEILQWINDGQRRLCYALEPLLTTATVTTVDGTREYLLPTDYISIKQAHFYDTSAAAWTLLGETTWQTLFDNDADFENDDDGLPTQFYWRQNVIGLVPAPDATYAGSATLRILYSYYAADLSADSDTSGLDAWLDDALLVYCMFRIYQKDRDFNRAQAADNEFGRILALAMAKYQRQRKEHAPRLIPQQRSYRTYWTQRLGRNPGLILTSGTTV